MAIKFLLFHFISILFVSSCSYEKTSIDISSLFDPTWDFSNTAQVTFDENYVEIKNGKAQLKALDLIHEGDDFNNFSQYGFKNVNNRLSLKVENTYSETSIANILSEKYANVIGYWRLDNSTIDLSTYSNDLSQIGNASWVTSSKLGSHASEFDGVNSRLEVSHQIEMSGLSALSFSLWVKFDSLATSPDPNDTETILVKGARALASFSEVEWSLERNNNGNLFFRVYEPAGAGASSISVSSFSEHYAVGSWYHIAGTWDSVSQNLYINGDKMASSISPTPLMQSLPSQSFKIGGGDTLRFFDGSIDETAIFNTKLSDDEIKKIYSAQNPIYNDLSPTWTPQWDNIVGYWKMDETWQDSSGNSNHAVPKNNDNLNDNIPVTVSESKVGSSAGHFDDEVSLQYAEVTNSPSLENVQESSFTLQAWYKPEELPNNTLNRNLRHGIIAKQGYHMGLMYDENGHFIFNWYDSSDTSRGITSPSAYSPGSYYHLMAVANYEDNYIYLYVNGQLVISRDISAYTVREYSNYTWKIGTGGDLALDTNYSWFADGEIDDVAIWSAPLSSSEVVAIYNRQKQKYAGHYNSQIIELGSTSSNWPNLSWSTYLPFGKELVGDFDNDGNLNNEKSSDYFGLNGNLSDGLIGYWPLNENTGDSLGSSIDFEDKSQNNNHGTEFNGPELGWPGQLSKGVKFDGSNDYLLLPTNFDFSNMSFSISIWFKCDELTFSGVSSDDLLSQQNGSGFGRTMIGISYSNSELSSYLGGAFRDSGVSVVCGKWYNAVLTYSLGTQNLSWFINGEFASSHSLVIESANGPLIVGANKISNTNLFKGVVDDLAIWSKQLSNEEIQQLYRRGANRIKFQVKSCIDSSCECKSLSASPVASAADCDGDTIVNSLDFDDSHKAQFIGPGGDGKTYYSEFFNRQATDLGFDCSSNTSDSDGNVCVNDEILFSGSVKPASPVMDFSNFPLKARPIANPYFQYRVYMEADDNKACSGNPCLPELTSVSVKPNDVVKYVAGLKEVKPKNSINYKKLMGINITADSCVSFRLKRGDTYYHYDSMSWAPVTSIAHRSLATEVENNIQQFDNQFGPGELEVIAYLETNLVQEAPCGIDEIDVNYK